MSRTIKLALFALGFLAASGLETVRAGEAFLCEGGRIVDVPFGKLDEMKRTDPCVAAYFGLTVKPAGPSDRIETGAVTKPSPAPVAVERVIPAERPSTAPVLREAVEADHPKARVAAKMAPLRAAEGTDYRNVVILNPEAGSPAIFRHER